MKCGQRGELHQLQLDGLEMQRSTCSHKRIVIAKVKWNVVREQQLLHTIYVGLEWEMSKNNLEKKLHPNQLTIQTNSAGSVYWSFFAFASFETSGTKNPSMFSKGAMYWRWSLSHSSITGPASSRLLLCGIYDYNNPHTPHYSQTPTTTHTPHYPHTPKHPLPPYTSLPPGSGVHGAQGQSSTIICGGGARYFESQEHRSFVALCVVVMKFFLWLFKSSLGR